MHSDLDFVAYCPETVLPKVESRPGSPFKPEDKIKPKGDADSHTILYALEFWKGFGTVDRVDTGEPLTTFHVRDVVAPGLVKEVVETLHERLVDVNRIHRVVLTFFDIGAQADIFGDGDDNEPALSLTGIHYAEDTGGILQYTLGA